MTIRLVATGIALMLVPCLASSAQPCQSNEVSADMEIASSVPGSNEFALDLYRQLSQKPGNLFFSPFSLTTALAMTYAGARSDTEREMAATLHFPADQQVVHKGLAALQEILVRDQEKTACRLALANRLWGRDGVPFLPTFLQTTRENYAAELTTLDFGHQPEAARATINRWVAAQTEDNILELLLPGDIDIGTELVLTNAIYFRAQWALTFPVEQTRKTLFHISATEQTATAMMSGTGRFAYAGMPDIEVLQLPYACQDLAMVIVLPREIEGLSTLESSLDPLRLQELLDGLQEEELGVFLPRFSLQTRFELQDVLQRMGMVKAFTAEADFSGMTKRRGLFINRVIHEATIEVDEQGTEAAAATAVVLKRGPRPFRADHPFLFLIRDLRTGCILFMGRVLEPLAS